MNRVQTFLHTDKRAILVLVAVFVLSLPQLVLVRRVSPTFIRGDGVGYYAPLRSLLFDGDLDFANEYAHFSSLLPEGEQPLTGQFLRARTERGYVPTNWPVGPALLWLPFFAVGHAVARLAHGLGASVTVDGYSLPYQAAVAVGSCVYAFLGLLLVYRLCRRYYTVGVSLGAVLCIWFATSLTAYMYFMVSMSHACSFFAVSLFLLTWHRGRGSASAGRAVVLGLLVGLMALQRYQNAAFVVVLPWEMWTRLTDKRRHGGVWPEVLVIGRFALIAGCVATAVFSVQAAYWKLLYGRFLVQIVAENMGEKVRWFSPHIVKVLFSSNRGLIPWTPIVAFGLMGLHVFQKRDRILAVTFLSVFLANAYVIGCLPRWHGDASFGSRYFVSCGAIFALGLAACFDWLSNRRIPARAIAACCLFFVLWNYLLLYQYGRRMIPRYGPVSWREVIHNSFVVIPRSVFSKARDRAGLR